MEPQGPVLAVPLNKEAPGSLKVTSEQSHLCCLQLQRGTVSMDMASG